MVFEFCQLNRLNLLQLKPSIIPLLQKFVIQTSIIWYQIKLKLLLKTFILLTFFTPLKLKQTSIGITIHWYVKLK